MIAGAVGDHEAARQHLEDGVDLLGYGQAPHERAQARVALAITLRELGRLDAAVAEARSALDAFAALGAERDARRTGSFLRSLGATSSACVCPALTPRETEVVRLVAAGRSNAEIAEELVLSVRTVERHLENVYGKIGAGGRSARATAAAYALRNGLG
jgi:DNA-binding NarL/FixJ family response regulator